MFWELLTAESLHCGMIPKGLRCWCDRKREDPGSILVFGSFPWGRGGVDMLLSLLSHSSSASTYSHSTLYPCTDSGPGKGPLKMSEWEVLPSFRDNRALFPYQGMKRVHGPLVKVLAWDFRGLGHGQTFMWGTSKGEEKLMFGSTYQQLYSNCCVCISLQEYRWNKSLLLSPWMKVGVVSLHLSCYRLLHK